MNFGRGGDEDAQLEHLKWQYPRWRIWRGLSTGDYWAMPPRGHPALGRLISARNIGELRHHLAQLDEPGDE